MKGFTLVELLVVIAIIGVLATGVLMLFNPLEQIQKSNDARRKSDLAQIQRALEQFYQDYNGYPYSYENAIENAGGQKADWGSGNFTPYIQTIPKDPSSNRTYRYVSVDRSLKTGNSYPQSYSLYASLERGSGGKKDPQLCNSDGSKCGGAPENIYCGSDNTKICNYGVSSSNATP